jgi:hypothetical protein
MQASHNSSLPTDCILCTRVHHIEARGHETDVRLEISVNRCCFSSSASIPLAFNAEWAGPPNRRKSCKRLQAPSAAIECEMAFALRLLQMRLVCKSPFASSFAASAIQAPFAAINFEMAFAISFAIDDQS